MFDLLVYDRRQTAKLLRRSELSLPGKAVESALLPTTEMLILMREGMSCTLYLHGASKFLPTVAIKENEAEFNAPLLIPLTARKLMGGSQRMNIQHASRVDFKNAMQRAREWDLGVSDDVAVQVEQH
jgi:hypothetical protein